MRLEESSIYVSLKRLRKMVYEMQFTMTKANRPIYGASLIRAAKDCMASFMLAFTLTDKKMEYLEKSMGHFYVLKEDLLDCFDNNIIHYKKNKQKKDKNGNPVKMLDSEWVDNRKIEATKLIAKIDSDMCKWWNGLAKGKSNPNHP